MFSLSTASLAFTSPSALFAASTERAPAVSMGFYANSADSTPQTIGLNQYAWSSTYDKQTTLGVTSGHTNHADDVPGLEASVPAPKAVVVPAVPVVPNFDSVQMIGLNQYDWPSTYDRQATMGVASGHTNYADGAPPALEASVPAPVVVPEPVVGKVVPVAAEEEAAVEEAAEVAA